MNESAAFVPMENDQEFSHLVNVFPVSEEENLYQSNTEDLHYLILPVPVTSDQ